MPQSLVDIRRDEEQEQLVDGRRDEEQEERAPANQGTRRAS